MDFVGGMFSYEPADDGELVRLVALRGQADPADPPVGRRRVRPRRGQGRRHHLRGDAQGLLRPDGPPRGHGRQPDRGADVLPVLPPVLRPDLHGGARTRSSPPVRPGLQRLDGRGVVRRLGRPPDPADHHPALGRRAGRGRGAPQRRARRARRLLQRDPAVPGPAVDPHRTYWEPFFGACDETGTVINMHIGSSLEDAVDVGRRPGRGRLDADLQQRHELDGRLAVLGVAGQATRR